MGGFNEALDAYNKSLELNPNNILSYNNKNIVISEMGNLNEALDAYNKSLELKPDNYLA